MGYPSAGEELRMLALPHRGVTPDMLEDIRPLLDAAALQELQRRVDGTHVPDAVMRLLVDVVRRTRLVPGVSLGGSPRATVHLLTAARASARLDGREAVSADDVRRMAFPVLAHRIIAAGATGDEVVARALDEAAAGRS
jgi:MoxR-like ATPase